MILSSNARWSHLSPITRLIFHNWHMWDLLRYSGISFNQEMSFPRVLLVLRSTVQWNHCFYIPAAKLKSFPRQEKSDVNPLSNFSLIVASSMVIPDVASISSTVNSSWQSSADNTCNVLTFKLDDGTETLSFFSFPPHPASKTVSSAQIREV